MVANSKILFFLLDDEIFFVYLGSINFQFHLFKVLISFETDEYLSRTLGISVKSKSRIFRINNEIK